MFGIWSLNFALPRAPEVEPNEKPIKLLKCFDALIEKGNSVLIIEHNMDVIKCADWIIDLGPEAGDKGGEIVAEGTPENVAKSEKSHTGLFLRKYLEK